MLNAKIIYEAIKSLDGRKWNSREELEDAIFPLYGDLSSIFHGEGHRDLVDRLINARWVDIVAGQFMLFCPFEFSNKTVQRLVDWRIKSSPEELVELYVSELQLLLKLIENPEGVAIFDENEGKRLVELGLIKVLPDQFQKEIDETVNTALMYISVLSYQAAIDTLQTVIKLNLKKSERVYGVTEKGRIVKFSIK